MKIRSELFMEFFPGGWHVSHGLLDDCLVVHATRDIRFAGGHGSWQSMHGVAANNGMKGEAQ